MMSERRSYRVVFFDLENSPIVSYNWGIYEQNAVGVVRDWYLMSFSVAGLRGKPVTYTLADFPLYKRDPHNDRDLCRKLWEIFNDADLIVAHNGDRHDIRKSNARFIKHGLQPPALYKTVDTLKIARKYFAFTSNKLDDLAKYLGVGQKVKTGGFGLWLDCMNGDRAAWEKMRRYNGNDVVILRKVYEVLIAWHGRKERRKKRKATR